MNAEDMATLGVDPKMVEQASAGKTLAEAAQTVAGAGSGSGAEAAAAGQAAKPGLWSRVPMTLKAPIIGGGMLAGGLGLAAPVAGAAGLHAALQPSGPHVYGRGMPMPGGGAF